MAENRTADFPRAEDHTADFPRGERIVASLIGLIAGLLLFCLGALLLMASGSQPAALAESAPAEAEIQADISEAYLNSIFLADAATYPSPWPLEGGQLDLLPGNLIGFAAQVQSPLGSLTVKGTATIVARDGQLQIGIAEVRLGPMPVAVFMRLVQPELESQLNSQANQQLLQRTAEAGLTLLALTTDDSQMHAYLAAK